MSHRLKSIDYLRCIACLFIINSHIGVLYPARLSRLAWGGYFGNCIFFFVSGFCLVNIRDSFPKWYYKRFIRVYIPYVISIPIVFFSGVSDAESFIDYLMPFKDYHFIPTILFLYVGYYFLLKLHRKGVSFYSQVIAIALFMIAYFFLVYDYEKGDIYAHLSVLEMLSYMVTMLLGAVSAFKSEDNKMGIIQSTMLTCACFLLYAYQSIYGFPKVLSILQLFIGVGFAAGIGSLMIRCEDKLVELSIIKLASLVTLEAYIVHYICIEAYKGIGFPTNLMFLIISILSVSYCLHNIADRVIKRLQTVKL